MTLFVENLTCRRGDRLVIDSLSLAVPDGSALLLRGPNGAGKSTLLRTLAGLLRPTGGRISLGDLSPDDEDWPQTLVYCGHLDAVKSHLSVRENLGFWAAIGGCDAGAALDAAGLARLAGLPAFALSAGQRKRLNLARLMLAPRKLWLLDEPAASLDAEAQTALAVQIDRHLGSGGIAVIATHQDLALTRATTFELAQPRQPVLS